MDSYPEIRPAVPSDAAAIRSLIESARLPHQDLGDLPARLTSGLLGAVAESGGSVVGCALVEPYGATGLLRSVAVDAAWRRHGVGERIVDCATRRALEAGLEDLVLLTETAATFFDRLGFVRVARDEVPESVRASSEFTSVCPVSAQAMRRRTRPPQSKP